LQWKAAFAKTITDAKGTQNSGLLGVGTPVVAVHSPRGSIVACGKVAQIIDENSSFAKYKLQVFKIIGKYIISAYSHNLEKETTAVPTEKYLICPSKCLRKKNDFNAEHLVYTFINAPRRASTAFMFFAMHHRTQRSSYNPTYIKMMSDQWDSLNNQQKEKFVDMAKADSNQCTYDNMMYRYIDLINKAQIA
jgi:hypothetical protein